MNKIILNLVLCIGFFSPSISFASPTTLTEWGTVASVVSGDCANGSCSPLNVLLNGIKKEAVDGGVNQLNAETGKISIVQGNAQATATISEGGLATPTLKAKASSSAEFWLGAGAFAIQGYEYTGAIAKTINLDITFDGNITNPDADLATGFGVGMYLFTSDQVGFADVLDNPYAVLGALALTAQASIPEEQIFQLNVTGDGSVNESRQLSILLAPGDEFYLAGGVLAAAGGAGAIADAFGTLEVDFSQQYSGLLRPASVSQVPLPPTVFLFIPALFSLIKFRKIS